MPKILTWEDCGLPSASPILQACSISKSGMVYTSGSVGIRPDGSIPEDVEEQTEIAIKNLITVLDAAGSGIDSVSKVLVFVTEESFCPKVNEIYKKYFTTKPPRSCIVCKLTHPKLYVELEVVAEVK